MHIHAHTHSHAYTHTYACTHAHIRTHIYTHARTQDDEADAEEQLLEPESPISPVGKWPQIGGASKIQNYAGTAHFMRKIS
jgi:hypothetical protein